jgi:DNA-binding IclR family transcriptional regulator
VVTWAQTGPVILFNVPGERKTMFDLRNGPISILWTGSGNVFIAYLSREETRPVALAECAGEEECDDILDDIASSVRAKGYAVQTVKELPGFVAISAPIWNSNAEISHALTLTAPTGQIDVSDDGPHVRALLRASRAASQSLGAQP